MSRFYKLIDIIEHIKNTPLKETDMLFVPEATNYVVELDKSDMSSGSIYEIKDESHKSYTPLSTHILLRNISDDCYIKLCDWQQMLIKIDMG